MSCRQLYDKIKSIKLDEDMVNVKDLNSPVVEEQMDCVKTLMNTELNYLRKIQDLLVVMHNSFEKFSLRPVVTKSQLLTFYLHLPTIFDFHFVLRLKLNKELSSSRLIGKCFIEFLVNPDVFDIYLAYIKKVPVYLNLCQQIKLNESSGKHPFLSSLESIIMMPIQRFPQLQLVIGDIYKRTIDTHEDKVDLYKTMCLLKSISMGLDEHQRHLESTDINEISNFMKRLKISLKSQKVILRNSVFYLKPDFAIPRRLIKLSYYLILCDKEMIMYPRDSHMVEIPQDMVFYYSFDEINFQIRNTFNFSNQNKSKEFQTAKELFPLIKDSFMDDRIIVEVEEMLNDHNIIINIYDDMKRLNFSYDSLDQMEIAKSLLKLEEKLSVKERELNNSFNSILNLKIIKTGVYEDLKLFQFDSARLANEWKTNFYRTKLLYNINPLSDWAPIVIGNQSISNNAPQEFPLSFDPYFLNENGIINIPASVVRSQTIIIPIGTKISRCLWVSMNNGSVIILHFNYKAWTVLESFQTHFQGPIENICNFSHFDPNIADIPLDSEMWVSQENQIISYSLECNDRSCKKFGLRLPSKVMAMCQFDGKMFIGLQSLKVYIYSNNVLSRWVHESTICLQACNPSHYEKLQKIVFGHKSLVYFVFKRLVAVYDISESPNQPLNVFTTMDDICCFSIQHEGIWISLIDDFDLKMYDNAFKLVLQKLRIPKFIHETQNFGTITSILFTDKYLWIGTSTGLLTIVSTIDRMSCIDSKVTMYLNSKYSKGPIDILLPFQSIHGISLKSKYQAEMKTRKILDAKIPQTKRRHTTPSKLEGHHKDFKLSSEEDHNSHEPEDDAVPCACNATLVNICANLKNSTPMIILAFGNEPPLLEDDDDEHIYVNIDQIQHNKQSLFTYLE